MTRIEIAKAF